MEKQKKHQKGKPKVNASKKRKVISFVPKDEWYMDTTLDTWDWFVDVPYDVMKVLK